MWSKHRDQHGPAVRDPGQRPAGSSRDQQGLRSAAGRDLGPWSDEEGGTLDPGQRKREGPAVGSIALINEPIVAECSLLVNGK